MWGAHELDSTPLVWVLCATGPSSSLWWPSLSKVAHGSKSLISCLATFAQLSSRKPQLGWNQKGNDEHKPCATFGKFVEDWHWCKFFMIKDKRLSQLHISQMATCVQGLTNDWAGIFSCRLAFYLKREENGEEDEEGDIEQWCRIVLFRLLFPMVKISELRLNDIDNDPLGEMQ